MKKKISIIVNCFNGEKYLKQTVDSILKQEYENWELIFVDNASNDNSKRIFFSFKDHRLKYFFLENGSIILPDFNRIFLALIPLIII